MIAKDVKELDLSGPGAAYIRVSDDQQDTKRQYDSAHEFEKRYGVTIPAAHWFKDEGWARDTADRRPDFQRTLKFAEEGRIKWIVVDRLDRFGAKSAKHLMGYLARLEDAGCRLFDASGKEWTGEDHGTEISAWVEGKKSKGEQLEKSHRALTGKVARVKTGEWQGGPVRLGFDVVCYARVPGCEVLPNSKLTEHWRVVFEGLHKRLKVYPDGRTERFDGKGNFPRYQDQTEVLRLAPSNDPAKIDVAVSVFKRFATESISPTTLAHYLHKLGFRTAFGGPYQGHHVRSMLEDPTYIGFYTYNRKHFGKFHRFKDGQAVEELNYEEKQSRNDKTDWVQSHRLFDPMVDRATWDAVQKKLEAPKRETAPRSPALYLAGLARCGNCGSKMIAGRGKSLKRSGTLRFEFICGGYHKATRDMERLPSTCLRNGVFQDELEPFIDRYLEEAGKRLELLTQSPDGKHLLDVLEKQESDAWAAFSAGVLRLTQYLAEFHTDEYNAILAWDAARRADEEAATATPTRPLDAKQKERLNRVIRKAKTITPPPDDFVRSVLASYRANFDGAALAAEVEKLEAKHTALMRQWADLPTPRAKEKAKAELAELEARIEELERQKQDSADAVEQHYREIIDLQCAIGEARRALRSESGERALRQRAEALRAVIHRMECTFVATGEDGSGRGRKSTRLAKVSIYPIAGNARHFLTDSANLLRPTRATSHM